jgi:hypothetical protein
MGKLVVLELFGKLGEKLEVKLEIKEEGNRLLAEAIGSLPPDTDMAEYYKIWRSARYEQESSRSQSRSLDLRIKPIDVKTSVSDREFEKNHQKFVKNCESHAKKLSEHLNTWLNKDSFMPINNKLKEELRSSEEIRVMIRTSDIKLEYLPWQTWGFFKYYRHAEPILSPSESEQIKQQFPSKFKVKILAILGNSGGINLEKDRELLQKQLPTAKIAFFKEPDRTKISDQLWEQRWDILFFAGHSATEGGTGRIYINQNDSLTIEDLSNGLSKAVKNGLQLAIFNSCDGLGLARKLAKLQIPQVIVMREPVPDPVAHEFLKYFLQSFSSENGDNPLHLAVREARERLQILEKEFPCATWLPVIYQHPEAQPLTWKGMLGSNRQQKPLPPPVEPGSNILPKPTPKPKPANSINSLWRFITKPTLKDSILDLAIISLIVITFGSPINFLSDRTLTTGLCLIGFVVVCILNRQEKLNFNRIRIFQELVMIMILLGFVSLLLGLFQLRFESNSDSDSLLNLIRIFKMALSIIPTILLFFTLEREDG